MTGVNTNVNKMFRWLRDKKKGRQGKKTSAVEDDYGFRKKKQIIVQETENGHSVIIKDSDTTLVYPQSFCHFTYRARMPTPVQNIKETSSHIYDEIPEVSAKRTLEFDGNENEADIIKDTHRAKEHQSVDLRNAIEVGPYLIVPIVNGQSDSNSGDVEILRRSTCECSPLETCKCSSSLQFDTSWSGAIQSQGACSSDIQKDTKVVLTRCVKSKVVVGAGAIETTLPVCSTNIACANETCSFDADIRDSESCLPTLTDSQGDDSSSRTLTETPDSSMKTIETTLPEASESSAIKENEIDERFQELNNADDTCCEYDLSTSDESDISANSCLNDYELYLSKIENNLKLKHNVRKIIENIGGTIVEESASPGDDVTELDSMTYVSSLSEYSSAASHISDVSADRSASDDSSGYYECSEEHPAGRGGCKRECRVNLERSLSAPNPNAARLKSSSSFAGKRSKDKTQSKRKGSQTPRTNSFDRDIYKALSDEDREMYLFPSGKKSDSGSSTSSKSRNSRTKPVLAPQPTPVYMDPYRGKPRNNHNRLLGDLIRMNYDKQLFIH